MSKKPLSADELRGQMLQGNFARRRDLPAPGDPIVETPLPNLDITRIKFYEDNPRRERNASYDDLKESIRSSGGLKQPLIVTRRPGDELYIVEYGGNTRLQILKELSVETKDRRFARTNANFRPWVSESYVLMNHLDENDLRAPLIFIDKARAYLKLKHKVEVERNTEFSQREYIAYLEMSGRKLSRKDLYRMNYAVDVLDAIIPEAMRCGLGPWVVDRINRMQTDYSSYWTQRFPERALDEFDHLFQDTLRRHDNFEFNVDVARDALDEVVSDHCAISLRELRMEIDAMSRGITIDLPSSEKDGLLGFVPNSNSIEVSTPVNTASGSDAATTHTVTQPVSRAPTNLHTPTQAATPPRHPNEPVTSARLTENDSVSTVSIELLRARNYAVATKLAKHFDLDACISPATIGLGFFVDLPNLALTTEIPGLDTINIWVWWLLLSASEQAVNMDRLKLLPQGNRMREMSIAGQYKAIEAIVGAMPKAATIYFQVFNDPFVHESEELFHSLFALGSNARQIRSLSGDTGAEMIWGGVS